MDRTLYELMGQSRPLMRERSNNYLSFVRDDGIVEENWVLSNNGLYMQIGDSLTLGREPSWHYQSRLMPGAEVGSHFGLIDDVTSILREASWDLGEPELLVMGDDRDGRVLRYGSMLSLEHLSRIAEVVGERHTNLGVEPEISF